MLLPCLAMMPAAAAIIAVAEDIEGAKSAPGAASIHQLLADLCLQQLSRMAGDASFFSRDFISRATWKPQIRTASFVTAMV